MIIVAGDSQRSVNKQLHKALDVLGSTVKEVLNLSGHSRPGKEDGHEQYASSIGNHTMYVTNDNSFGFEDGISNPVVKGLGDDVSGQGPVKPG